MVTKELLEEALKLKPEDRFTLVEGLIKSLDGLDKKMIGNCLFLMDNTKTKTKKIASFF